MEICDETIRKDTKFNMKIIQSQKLDAKWGGKLFNAEFSPRHARKFSYEPYPAAPLFWFSPFFHIIFFRALPTLENYKTKSLTGNHCPHYKVLPSVLIADDADEPEFLAPPFVNWQKGWNVSAPFWMSLIK